MKYYDYYLKEAAAITGKMPTASEGMTEVEFNREYLYVQIPSALKEFYLALAKHPSNRVYNTWFAPVEMELRRGFLWFMDENQSCWQWGIKEEDISKDNPEVWQLREYDNFDFFSEEKTLTDFLMFHFYHNVIAAAYDQESAWCDLYDKFEEIWPEHYSCVFCGKTIDNLTDYEPFGLTTYDVHDPAYKLNYRGTHRKCLKK